MVMRAARILALAFAVALGHAGTAAAQTPKPDPTQDASFQIFVRGVPIGTEHCTISRRGDEWHLRATSELAPPIALSLKSAWLRYTLDWRPLAIELKGTLRDTILDVTSTIDGATATTSTFEDGKTVERYDRVWPDTLLLPNNIFGAYGPVALRMLNAGPGAVVHAYAPPFGEVQLVLDTVRTQRLQTLTTTFDVKLLGVTLKLPSADVALEIYVEQDNGHLLRVRAPSSGVEAVRSDVATVGTREQTFAREGDEQVRVPANGFNLAATVSRPAETASNARTVQGRHRKFPAVVIVGHSQAPDRDAAATGFPVYGQLAGSLADTGMIVLRYDRRGTGQSGGRVETSTISDYADDVVATVRWLAERDEVDDKQIFVVGHADGGWMALLAAAREKRIARLALVGVAGTTGAQFTLEQQQRALERSSLGAAERQQRIDLQKKIHDAVMSGGSWDGVPEELRRQADTPWFQSVLAFDPAVAVSKTKQPLLVIAGAADRDVPSSHADKLGELARARKKAGPVDTLTLPGVSHVLVEAAGENDEYSALAGKPVAPSLVQALAKFFAPASGAPSSASK